MIETVLGPIDASTLGPTCMHDHVLADSSTLQRAGASPAPADETVAIENLGYLRWNMLAFADNLRLDDPHLAVEEVGNAVSAGQFALVESSSLGLGPDHAGLPEIARRSGMSIVSSYGTYIPRTVPDSVAELTEQQLEGLFRRTLHDAVPGTEFRAGMLGIMGTTDAFEERERAQLRAAARAASDAGCAVSVRLDQDTRWGLDVLALMAAEGLPASRVIFTNADEYMDAGYWDELADAGAVLEMCFGTEAMHLGRLDNPTDHERIPYFLDFLETHPHSRHVLGQSVWTKAQLRAFGGYGYAHLMATIAPVLVDRGLSAERVERMLVDEPRRLLDRG
ncbi:phosphotriesterase-related protein [Microbacterium sediminicola]|uniref:Phosphotriesterase-related protein n=1 Tax=Microbacterium sediminicola TaxID=415210 RepID=A0ABP4TI12_9MICO